MSKTIEKKIEQGQAGIPAYAGGLIADLNSESGPALAVSLAYGNCEDAEKAVTGLQARWKEGMTTPVSATGKTVEDTQGGCAAVVRFGTKADGPDALADFMNTYMQRGFNILQIARRGHSWYLRRIGIPIPFATAARTRIGRRRTTGKCRK